MVLLDKIMGLPPRTIKVDDKFSVQIPIGLDAEIRHEDVAVTQCVSLRIVYDRSIELQPD